jgi:nitrate/nitrite-specific signal transduction histidine kinase
VLEQRIAERTAELADAERVLRRMWTLGTRSVALELHPRRVLERFIEAWSTSREPTVARSALAHVRLDVAGGGGHRDRRGARRRHRSGGALG